MEAVRDSEKAETKYTFAGKPLIIDASIAEGALRLHPATYFEWFGCAPGYHIVAPGLMEKDKE